jgi:hypothetical protein
MDWFDREVNADEERAVEAFMARLAETPTGAEPSLSGADVLWWKAQLLRRWEAERKVQAPLDLMEPFQMAAALAAVAAVVVWALPSVVRAFSLIHI